MNSMRNLFITGVALFLGMSIPEYLREYTSKALHGPTHTKARWVSLLFYYVSIIWALNSNACMHIHQMIKMLEYYRYYIT
jgi:hypothetical protein